MIKILTSGLYTSLQDLGRFGHRNLGIPLSGMMDRQSGVLANTLVNNKADTVVLEITAIGPILKFETACTIAITGARFNARLNGKKIRLNTAVNVLAGSTLNFGELEEGLRAYLAIKGGFISETVLGSKSYSKDITTKVQLHKGDELQIGTTKTILDLPKQGVDKGNFGHTTKNLEVYAGPEFTLLKKAVKDSLLAGPFTVSVASNRMAYLLEHSFALSANEIITAPVQPGTVQLTPNGTLMVLMRDAHTTGGYARVLQLTENAIDLLSQKKPGDALYLCLIEN